MQGKAHTPLENLDQLEFNAVFARLDDYLAEATFYGFYPSIYSPGGYPYLSFWTEPAMYERLRAQFRQCMPVLDRLQEVG